KQYERNPRKNDKEVDRMAEAIREYGFNVPLLAKKDGTIIDGHLRYKGALRLNFQKLPVITIDHMTETQVKAFRLLVNQSTNWAKWDMPLLKMELEDLRLEDFDLGLVGFDDKFYKDLKINDILLDEGLNINGDIKNQEKPDNDYEGDNLSDNNINENEGDGYNEYKTPLSIILNQRDFIAWQEYKEKIGLRSDTKAFLELFKAVEKI
ncbi:MAG: ParB N-terminal domain-containing protein, partial [Clostridiales Family XIII bacterium]|nr:ParB N-terminal domain-containing protein [Clostridiales Family XIII bacterium]